MCYLVITIARVYDYRVDDRTRPLFLTNSSVGLEYSLVSRSALVTSPLAFKFFSAGTT